MSELTFTAEPRTVLGKKVGQLRRDGFIPGVVYGPVVPDTVPVSVNRRDFERFYKAHGHSTLFTLTWEGGERPVFIRDVQQDPVRRVPLHVDFFAPNLQRALRTMVQVVFHSPAEHIEGVLTELRTEVEIEALPANVPNQIDVDLSALVAVGDAVHVSDVTAPDGVTILTAPEELLAHVTPLAVEPEPEEEVEAEDEAEAPEATAESTDEEDSE